VKSSKKEEHSLVLVLTTDGIEMSKRDDGSWILPLPIAAVGGCYISTTIYCYYLEKSDAQTTTDRCGAVDSVLRFQFDHLVFRGSIGFLDFRKQVWTRKTTLVLHDNDAAENAGCDEELQRTSYAGSDYQCPLQCVVLISCFGILP